MLQIKVKCRNCTVLLEHLRQPCLRNVLLGRLLVLLVTILLCLILYLYLVRMCLQVFVFYDRVGLPSSKCTFYSLIGDTVVSCFGSVIFFFSTNEGCASLVVHLCFVPNQVVVMFMVCSCSFDRFLFCKYFLLTLSDLSFVYLDFCHFVLCIFGIQIFLAFWKRLWFRLDFPGSSLPAYTLSFFLFSCNSTLYRSLSKSAFVGSPLHPVSLPNLVMLLRSSLVLRKCSVIVQIINHKGLAMIRVGPCFMWNNVFVVSALNALFFKQNVTPFLRNLPGHFDSSSFMWQPQGPYK